MTTEYVLSDYRLYGPVLKTDTSITVVDGTGLPTSGRIRINGEEIFYSDTDTPTIEEAPNALTLIISDRGINGSVITEHKRDSIVWLYSELPLGGALNWPGRCVQFEVETDHQFTRLSPKDESIWSFYKSTAFETKTSSTTRSFRNGYNTFVTNLALDAAIGSKLRIHKTSDATQYMDAVVVEVDGTTLHVEITKSVGSGSNNAWTITKLNEAGTGYVYKLPTGLYKIVSPVFSAIQAEDIVAKYSYSSTNGDSYSFSIDTIELSRDPYLGVWVDEIESGENITTSTTPATPTVVLANNTKTITLDLTGSGPYVATVFLNVEAIAGDNPLEKITVDWGEGDPAVDYILGSGDDEDLGIKLLEDYSLRARLSHEYTTSDDYTIVVTTYEDGTDVLTVELTVTVEVEENLNVDQILVERRVSGGGANSSLNQTREIINWEPLPQDWEVTDFNVPVETQYRVRYRALSLDGRNKDRGRAEVTSQFSSWSTAV